MSEIWIKIFFSALISAVLGALFTQNLNNFLTLRREKKNKDKESLKKFYYKVIPYIYDYFKVTNEFRKDSLVEWTDNSSFRVDIIKHVSENSLYITPNIHSSYIKVRSQNLHEDLSGRYNERAEVNLIYYIFDAYLNLLKKEDLKLYQSEVTFGCLLLMWKITVEINPNNTGYIPMSRRFYLDHSKFNEDIYNRLIEINHLVKRDEIITDFKYILKELINKEHQNDNEEYLDTFFEDEDEIQDTFTVTMLSNLDLDIGELSITQRRLYREAIISNLYNSLYYESKYNFNFTSDDFKTLHNEYKNAFFYLKDKKLVSIIKDDDLIKIELTAEGQEYYEINQFN
ncbi:hypothetical protein [Bacillus sp. AFS029533]|uniref:hypothetical protein n=1 Tax=Bacillus sp. AFS029533 TaxID=2033494 RepID=UPI000BFD8C26|nr:hypothetical protein [Bacillus sp. AFS029533]PGZ88989.1 hypothetical protein COE53_19190 [Bacillus sp. AFS029533]